MTLFEQLKMLPKVDMHINLTSSISTDLAFDLFSESNILDVLDEMQEKNVLEYEQALKLPIEILNNKRNIVLAIDNLIDRLISNNVIYGELFLDLPLYNRHIDEEKLLTIVLEAINRRNYNLQVVLVISSEREKEENLHTLEIYDKYYGHGVNGIYFKKNKMKNLVDYMYLFDRLIKNNQPYILDMNSKITNSDYDIYMHAKRIIYSLANYEENIINEFKVNDIMLEFGITRLRESNLVDLKDFFIYDFIKNNVSLTITSCDMTTLNTDILNEWCVMFNNYPFVLRDMIKIILNNLINANIDSNIKDRLIEEVKEKSNLVL